MKKILLILLSVSLLLCLCACGGDQTPTEPSETDPTVVTDPTNATDETIDDGKITYTVTITNEQGAPISGIMVQLCLADDSACFAPTNADANGVATFSMPEDAYKAKLPSLPAGLTYATDETEFYFAEGETSVTIVLKTAEGELAPV